MGNRHQVFITFFRKDKINKHVILYHYTKESILIIILLCINKNKKKNIQKNKKKLIKKNIKVKKQKK